MRLRLPVTVVAATVAAAVLAACADLTTQPDRHRWIPSLNVADNSTLTLMYCPRATSVMNSAEIGPEGGRLAAGQFTLAIPEGALPDTQIIRLTRPASDYLEVDAHVGEYDSYTFLKPVTFIVNYGNCPTQDDAPLSPVWIDGATNKVIQKLNGTVDTATTKVKFRTNHFSGYAIAYGPDTAHAP